MSNQQCIECLSPACFWDIDRESFDMDKYPAFIIARVLEVGNVQDWKLLLNYYGIDKIAKECMTLRYMHPRDLAFVTAMSGTNKEDYRCYQNKQ